MVWGLAIALLAVTGAYLAGWGQAWSGWTGRAVDVGELLLLVARFALAFLVALTAWSGPRVEGLEGFVALYLVWISALTMPHLALVVWMDVG